MCGIFFSIGFENLPASVIDSVTHRGPDGRGWNEFTSLAGPIIMAHRRLAIVDLSDDGHQPMASEDRRYWLTYNGEIYNYLEIREELKEAGYHIKTQTDTEVLLKSYLHWGADCLNKFNGMFAFVIWDDKEKKIFAARDRFGVKPLYYYKQGDKIAFASEIKQFKFIQGWVNLLNQPIAEEYLAIGYCDHFQETLYKNVFQLLPGHYLKLDSVFSEINPVCWYDLRNHIQPVEISDAEAVTTFKNIFIDAIRLRMRCDVSVGACLSGGLDSSSIVSMIKEIFPTQIINTFSSVFPGHSVDETVYIDELISEKKLLSYKNYPSMIEFTKSIDQIIYYQDLPFSGTSVFAQWKTFESAKKANVTVLLDGQGADESLLGYPSMLNGIIFDYLKKLKFISLYQFMKWQKNYNNQSYKKTFLLALREKFPNIYVLSMRILGRNVPTNSTPELSSFTEVCIHHFVTSLQTLLRYEDRNSMAFSRESRLPFLDYRLVEFILSLSINQKFRDKKTKWVLRESMKNTNIKSILTRKDKIGFATPENEWFSSKGNHPGSNVMKENTSIKEYLYFKWLNSNGF